MTDLPSKVTIAEEGPREGFQIESGPISTEQKISLVDSLSETGLHQIQVCSFVDPKRVPGMADAEQLVNGFTARPGVEYTAIWFNDQGFERARASGKLTLRGKIRSYPSKAFLQRNLNATPEIHMGRVNREITRCKELGIPVTEASVASAFGCNFEGDISVPRLLDEVAWIKDLVIEHSLSLDSLSLADTMAWATPSSIKRAVGAVREKFPEFRLRLHLHDTRGLGIANAHAGLEMGVDYFDAAIGGLGGCPFAAHKGASGNVCTEDLVFMCDEMGIESGIDLEKLIESARLAEKIFARPLPGQIMRGGSLKSLRQRISKAA